MQTWFDNFKRQISQKLVRVQALDLAGVDKGLVVLWATIEDIVVWWFSNFIIIEEALVEDILDICGTKVKEKVIE